MDFVKKGYSLDGFHRGKVVDNKDPLRLGRIRVKVSPWFDEVKDEDCPWAEPAWGSGILYIPPKNAWVWVFFERGDPEKPVWFAWSLPFNGVRYYGGVWDEFGEGAMDAGNMFAEQGAGYPGSVVWRLPMNSSLTFYADGRIVLKSMMGRGDARDVINAMLSFESDGTIVLINRSGSYIKIKGSGEIEINANKKRIDLNP